MAETGLDSGKGVRRVRRTPWVIEDCCSPETSITSRVRSSQGMWGKVMLRVMGSCYHCLLAIGEGVERWYNE